MQINLMTILADDYNSFSKDIVEVIAQQIKKVGDVFDCHGLTVLLLSVSFLCFL